MTTDITATLKRGEFTRTVEIQICDSKVTISEVAPDGNSQTLCDLALCDHTTSASLQLLCEPETEVLLGLGGEEGTSKTLADLAAAGKRLVAALDDLKRSA